MFLHLVLSLFVAIRADIYASNDGNDTTCAEDLSSPCETVSFACGLGGSPHRVIVDPGTFEETEGVTVDGALTVTGQSSSVCSLTKMNGKSFTLFTINESSANLTLTKLRIMLTNDAEGVYFIFASASDQIVIINECQITTQDSYLTYAPAFMFESNTTTFQINSCAVYNITTEKNAIFKMTNDVVNLSIVNSSFINIFGGGCFSLSGSSNISLTDCLFSNCKVGFEGSGCMIKSCMFLNINTTAAAWVLKLTAATEEEQSATIANTSFINCHGGVFYFQSKINATISDCSFMNCVSDINNGSAICSSCTTHISRCTFFNCTSKYGGAIYGNSSGVINIADSVFVNNSASTDGSGNEHGNDCCFVGASSFTFLRTFTDQKDTYSSVKCESSVSDSCQNTEGISANGKYKEATCDSSFSAHLLEECQMPCAGTDPGSEENSSACVKPDACPSNFAALGGQCVPTCLFSAPVGDNDTYTCVSPCVVDFSRGYPLCVTCAARKADSTQNLPCGSNSCYQQISNGGSGEGNLNTSCALSCDAKHFETDSDDGKCKLLPCKARRVNSLLKYPCGTADCFQQGAFIDECGDTPSQTNKGEGLSPGIIILIIVGSVVGVVVVIVVTGLVVWKKRRQKAYLKSDWILRVGAEVKDYLVYECDRIVNQDADMYVFVRGDDTYTVKVVRSKKGICSGDLSWAVDFSAKVNSRFLVRYIETINGNKGEFYVVMEYCAKGDLRTVLKSLKKVNNDTTLSLDAVVKILIQVLLGLEVLHSKGIVHCDLGLSSIFFDERGDAKIGNFGCTQSHTPWIKNDGTLLELEKMSYVPSAYHSSEYSAGKECTYSTDMWCLGQTLVEIYMFPKEVEDIVDPVQFINELVIPRELADIMSSLMDGDHENRPSAFALLQNAYIRERAEQLDLLKYFPPLSTTSE